MVDERLKENLFGGVVEKAATEKLEEGKMNLLQALDLQNRVEP